MFHIVSSCSQTKLEGGLPQLHLTEDIVDETWIINTHDNNNINLLSDVCLGDLCNQRSLEKGMWILCCLSSVRQDGLIKTELVYSILLRSNLRRDVLGYIWDMCNKSTPGQLSRQELFLILAMISIAQVNLSTSHSVCFVFCKQAFCVPNLLRGTYGVRVVPSLIAFNCPFCFWLCFPTLILITLALPEVVVAIIVMTAVIQVTYSCYSGHFWFLGAQLSSSMRIQFANQALSTLRVFL